MDLTEIALSAAGMISTGAVGVYAGRHTRRSADAGQAVSVLEAERWHADLTPKFVVTAAPANIDRAELWVELAGPVPLNGLDEIVMSVRDDVPGREPVSPAGPSAEEIAAQVYGPYQFGPYADGADAHGRGVAPFALQVGERRPFSLMKTRAPHWTGQSDEQWWQQWAGEPVRLELQCRQGDDPLWRVSLNVDVPSRMP
ncbi:hypothetical protein GCM10022254_09490 [Actinomadura meridiana]|uniref:Uncharacterized protein n=1 Tax=Actinomadura meridiana TaxID=559626 RepID=A0ABP8BTP9_9ACTN